VKTIQVFASEAEKIVIEKTNSLIMFKEVVKFIVIVMLNT